MKNRIEDLRDHLFETLEALKDKEEPMDLERAKVVSEVSQTLINTAKVEVDFLKVTEREKDAGFLSNDKPKLERVE